MARSRTDSVTASFICADGLPPALLENYGHLTRIAVHRNTDKVALRRCSSAMILVSPRETDVRRSQQPPRRDAGTAFLPAMLEARHLVAQTRI